MKNTRISETIIEETDAMGTAFIVLDKHKRSPAVEVFYAGGALCVRQDNNSFQVDMIELSLGQAYDLLLAVSKALDIPVRTT